jgi:hypothetical protein
VAGPDALGSESNGSCQGRRALGALIACFVKLHIDRLKFWWSKTGFTVWIITRRDYCFSTLAEETYPLVTYSGQRSLEQVGKRSVCTVSNLAETINNPGAS